MSLDNIKICVLSRREDQDRRRSIRDQLELLGVGFEFFDAITPASFDSKDLLESRFTPGERCCFLSHREMLSRFYKNNDGADYLLILEDDALLLPDFFDAISLIADKKSFSGAMVIGYSKVPYGLQKTIQWFRPVFSVKSIGRGFYVSKPYRQWHCGTVGYMIDRVSCGKYIDATNNSDIVADDWGAISKAGFDVWHLRPIVVIEDIANHSSSLEGERKTLKSRAVLFRYVAGFIRRFTLVRFYMR